MGNPNNSNNFEKKINLTFDHEISSEKENRFKSNFKFNDDEIDNKIRLVNLASNLPSTEPNLSQKERLFPKAQTNKEKSQDEFLQSSPEYYIKGKMVEQIKNRWMSQ
jgi:hypothetical protein